MRKILFIEDEESLQKAMGDMLESKGYSALRAVDGESGLAAARREAPDLILLDLILPKKNGFEVLEELKKDPSTKSIPVIVLTNLEGSAEVERALSLGATTYLVKANYKLDELLAKIETVFNHHS
ncbi:MAG: response regulator [Candidatus Giovannonibacteria bacterium]|nr:MAG: response regulator [Candidatus Giovannonibacteria bacterium]